ncbi:MAG: 5'-flap endonuclease [Candelina submexicana]|nr:MAG: 5'-flap endonuclease [Candelina submexicana]
MSSSPGLPSPSLLLRRQEPQVGKTPWARRSPQATNNRFMTASRLLQIDSATNVRNRTVDDFGDRDEESNNARAGTVFAPKDNLVVPTRAKSAGKARVVLGSNTARRTGKAGIKDSKVMITNKSYDTKAVGKGAATALLGTEPDCLPERKPRTRAKRTESQSKIAVNSLTKPSIRMKKKQAPVVEPVGSKIGDGAEEISRDVAHYGRAMDHKIQKEKTTGPSERDLSLDRAARRRIAWTPPIDTITGSGGDQPGSTEQERTEGLLSTFAYSAASDGIKGPMSTRTAGGEAFRKRRRIDLVEKPQTIDLTSSYKKPRAIKKKPRTITERATAIYVAENPAVVAPILQYVTDRGPSSGQRALGSLPSAVVESNDTKQSKKRTLAGITSTSPRKSARKGRRTQDMLLPTLLQPIEAQKEIDGQQLLFGTSSQLAEADSAAFARDIQQATTASERDIGLNTSVSSNIDHEVSYLPFVDINKPPLTRRQSLWSAAARNDDGSVMGPQPVQATSLSLLRRSTLESQIYDNQTPKISLDLHSSLSEASNLWTGIDGEVKSTQQKNSVDHTQGGPKNDEGPSITASRIVTGLAPGLASTAPSKKAPPRAKEQPVAALNEKPDVSLTNTVTSTTQERPAFEGYPTSRLATELKSYGFKPIKSRDQMILLLERCWEGKHRIALQSLPSNLNNPKPSRDISSIRYGAGVSPQASHLAPACPNLDESSKSTLRMPQTTLPAGSSTKKPRGRPRKTAPPNPLTEAASKHTSIQNPIPSAHEIVPTKVSKRAKNAVQTSVESHLQSTPPSRRQRTSPSTPGRVDPDALPIDDTLLLTPAAAQTHLFDSITKAVTSVPPSTDINKPTWHEKILMYDPIVLEDLSTWLNTQGLARVGVDREVGAVEVRDWCERNSVCCLWKENLRGRARSRY